MITVGKTMITVGKKNGLKMKYPGETRSPASDGSVGQPGPCALARLAMRARG